MRNRLLSLSVGVGSQDIYGSNRRHSVLAMSYIEHHCELQRWSQTGNVFIDQGFVGFEDDVIGKLGEVSLLHAFSSGNLCKWFAFLTSSTVVVSEQFI